MKRFLLLCAVCLSGCVNVERLNEKLQEGNATHAITIKRPFFEITIFRSNPTIGFSGSASAGGISHLSPSNIPVSVQYIAGVPGPTMPSATNQIPKSKP